MAISTFFQIFWAVLRPSEGGSQISGLFFLLFSTYSCRFFQARWQWSSIFQGGLGHFSSFLKCCQAFLRSADDPPGAGPIRIEARDVGMAYAESRPDGVRPPSGCPGGAIVSTAKAILSRYRRFPGISGGTRVRRHCAARPSIFWQSRRGVHKHRAIPEGQLYRRPRLS